MNIIKNLCVCVCVSAHSAQRQELESLNTSYVQSSPFLETVLFRKCWTTMTHNYPPALKLGRTKTYSQKGYPKLSSWWYPSFLYLWSPGGPRQGLGLGSASQRTLGHALGHTHKWLVYIPHRAASVERDPQICLTNKGVACINEY